MATDIATLGIEVQTSSVRRGSDDLDKLTGAGKRAEMSTQAVSNAFKALAGAVSIAEMSRAVETWQNLNAQLVIATGSIKGGADAYQEVSAIAERTGQSLEAIGTVYQRLSQSAMQIGISQKQVSTTTETVAKAMALSGASASSAQAAITQFGQALASGTLRGDELNSILEQSPRLAKALADGMGVPIGKLRELGAQGSITSEALVDALEKSASKLSTEFDQLPVTMSRALQKLQNEWVNTMGSFESSTGAFGVMAKGVDAVAKNLDTLASVGAVVAAVYGGRLVSSIVASTTASMAKTAATRAEAAVALAAAQAEVTRTTSLVASTAMMVANAAATNALTAANERLAVAKAGVEAASRGAMILGALGGPLGIVTTALTLGATAWMLWKDRTKEATEVASKSAIQNLDSVIAKVEEMNGRIDQVTRRAYNNTLESAQSEAKTVAANIDFLQKKLDSMDAAGEKGRYSEEGKSAQAELNELASREIELQKQLGLAREDSAKVGTAALVAFNNKYAVGAEEVRVKQEEILKAFADGIKNTGGVFDFANKDHMKALKALNAGLADEAKKDKPKGKEVDDFLTPAAKEYAKAIEQMNSAQIGADASTRELNGAQEALFNLMSSPEWSKMPETWKQTAIAQAGATSESIEALDAQKRLNEMISATPTAKLEESRARMMELKDAFEAGKITAEQFSEAAGTYLGTLPKEAEKTASSIDMAITNSFQGMSDALADFIMTGKGSFGDLVNSMIRDLIRLEIQMQMTSIYKSVGGISGIAGMLGFSFTPSPTTSGAGTATENWIDSGGLASTSSLPSFDVGTDYVPRDMVAKIHEGERITPAKFNPAIGNGDGVVVNINNNATGTQATQSTRQEGGKTIIDVLIDQVKSALINDVGRGGDFAGALEGTYAVNRSAGAWR